MPTNQPTADHFILHVTGERLRQVLAARMARIDTSIASEAALAETSAAHEKMVREHNEIMHKQFADLHAGMALGRGPMPVGSGVVDYPPPPPMPMHGPHLAISEVETPSERHLRTVETLRAALAETRWLHDNIDPTTAYALDKDDLQLFGDFGTSDSIISAIRRLPGLGSLI